MRQLYDRMPGDTRYFGSYDFTSPTIVLRDPELIKEITIKHFDHFTDHATYTSSDNVDPLLSKIIFYYRGDKWRDYRAVMSASFTGSKMKGMFNLINQCAINLKDYLHGEIQQEVMAIDTKDLFARYTTDVIASAAFGITVNSLVNRQDEFYEWGKQTTDIGVFVLLKLFIMAKLPFLARLLGIRVFSEKMTNYFTEIIRNNVEAREKHSINRPDMIQLMIEARDNPINGVTMDIEEMTSQAFTFFLAGFHTVSTTMCFVAHFLAGNPEVQETLISGIEQRRDALCDEATGYETIKDFHYLEACVNEALRMYSPNPGMDRVCTKRFQLPPIVPGGESFVVEPGMGLWIPYAGIHRDERYFERPEEFRPERFLDCDGKLVMKATDSTVFTPFGSGPRICLAHRFAMLEVKVAIVHLLMVARLLPSEKTPDPIRLNKEMIRVAPENGFWLNLKLREN